MRFSFRNNTGLSSGQVSFAKMYINPFLSSLLSMETFSPKSGPRKHGNSFSDILNFCIFETESHYFHLEVSVTEWNRANYWSKTKNCQTLAYWNSLVLCCRTLLNSQHFNPFVKYAAEFANIFYNSSLLTWYWITKFKAKFWQNSVNIANVMRITQHMGYYWYGLKKVSPTLFLRHVQKYLLTTLNFFLLISASLFSLYASTVWLSQV